MPREKIIMECTDCKSRNYFQDKNRRKKFCPRCNKSVLHKESK